MNIDYKKLLPSSLRNTRWGQFIEAFQEVMEQVKNDKVDIIKNQYDLSSMSIDDIINIAKVFGYSLNNRGDYTGTYDYIYKQISTLIPRILHRNQIKGYTYNYFIYNLTGTIYPTYLDVENNLIPIENWWSFNEVQAIHDTLDAGSDYVLFSIPYRLDSDLTLDSGMTLDMSHKVYSPSDEVYLTDTTLDEEVFENLDIEQFLENLTRHLILSYKFKRVEDENTFLKDTTLMNLYDDMVDMKRVTEVIYFEPILYANTKLDNTETNEIYYNYNKTISTSLDSILIGSDLSDVASISFGNSHHDTLSLSLTGVKQEIASYPISDFKIKQTSTNTHFITRKKITEKTKFFNFKEVAFFNTIGDCIYYAKFPEIRYLSDMYSNISFDINLV